MGQIDAAACLIYFGCAAPLNAIRNATRGQTAIELAKSKGYTEIADVLTQHISANLIEQDSDSDDMDDFGYSSEEDSHSHNFWKGAGSGHDQVAGHGCVPGHGGPGLTGVHHHHGASPPRVRRHSSYSRHDDSPVLGDMGGFHHGALHADALMPGLNEEEYNPMTRKIISIVQPVLKQIHRTVNHFAPKQAHLGHTTSDAAVNGGSVLLQQRGKPNY